MADLPPQRLPDRRRAARPLARDEEKVERVRAHVLDVDRHRAPHDLGRRKPGLAHLVKQPAEREPAFFEKDEAEGVHVGEVPIEGVGNDSGVAGDLA